METKVKTNISNVMITNTAIESQNEYNNEVQTSNATITVNKADLYLTSTVNKSKICIGDNFTITFKLGNRGPDTAKNVIVKIPVPEGLEFISASVDQGTWTYDKSTRTIIWNVGDVKIGDPHLYLNLKSIEQGPYIIHSLITTTTYDPDLKNSIMPVYINVLPESDKQNVNAANITVGMQKTGTPLNILVLAILAVLAGLTYSRKY